MSEQKTYVNAAFIKEVNFKNGGSILKLRVNPDSIAEQLKSLSDEKGWITLVISKRKSTGKRGETHCLWVDTWKPAGKP